VGSSKINDFVTGPSNTGTDPLIDHFPFVNFKDDEVITLFENIGFI
jgi:hypothetical protein